MKILITGSTGFIGSTMVDEGLSRNLQVWAGVRKSSSRAYLQNRLINFIDLDYSDKDKLTQQLSAHRDEYGKWDYIIHCAGVTKCRKQSDFYKVNFEGTRHFIEVLEALSMIPKQFIYLSSLSVFGPIKEDEPYWPINEHDTPQPNTAYGKSKLLAEQFIRQFPHLPYVIFRPTGVYGPRERDYYLMAKSIKQHIDFAVGYKKQVITFVYVKDLVQAVYLAIERGITKRCYFVTDGHNYSSRHFSDCIQKELGIKKVLHIKAPLFVLKVISLCAEKAVALWHRPSTLNGDKYKIMKQRNWQCDITPAENELGYRPQYDLERGTREMIAWYKKEEWL